jgi:hypothetical protein
MDFMAQIRRDLKNIPKTMPEMQSLKREFPTTLKTIFEEEEPGEEEKHLTLYDASDYMNHFKENEEKGKAIDQNLMRKLAIASL